MKIITEKNIGFIHSLTMSMGIGILILLIGYLSISNEYKNFEIEAKKFEKDFLKSHKENLKLEVKRAIDYINSFKDETEKVLKYNIKEESNEAYKVIESLYTFYRDKMDLNELKLLIKNTLRGIRFNEGRGYYFIDDIDGNCVLLPTAPKLEGTSFWNNQDADGHYIMREFIQIAKTKGEGFSKYKWYKPNEKEMSIKISFVKYFKPLDWIVGTGEYLDDVRDDIQKRVLKYISKIRFGNGGYFSIYKNDGTLLTIPSLPEIEGFNVYTQKILNTNDIVSHLIKLSKDGGGFYEYEWKKLNSEEVFPKIAYASAINEWNWTIAGGLYLDDLEEKLKENKALLQNSIEEKINSTFIIFTIAIIISIFVSLIFSKWINSIFNSYKISIENKNEKLKEFNLMLEAKVKTEVAKRREQEEILIQQSKMASMGEMISAIAHQWRQPLNALGLVIQKFKVYHDRGKLDEKAINNSTKKAMELINKMSRTIDDFRNFFKPNKNKKLFSVYESIQNVVFLLLAQLNHHNIAVTIKDLDIKINNYENEFEQIILNLMNNAKDAILEYREKIDDSEYKGIIEINLIKKENKVLIFIEDNGGGVKSSIKDKIFEPYFSTKDDNKGTGIGLYMTKKIVENMGGEIEVIDGKRGAVFKLTLSVE